MFPVTAFAGPGNKILAFSRSGRFSPEASPLLLGGLIVNQSDLVQIETELEVEARKLNFRIALEYGTNRHHPVFFEKSLKVLQNHSTKFVGAVIDGADLGAQPGSVTIQRANSEARFFASALSSPSLQLLGVRHAWEQDDEIYGYLEKQLNLQPTQIFTSMRHAPRLLQVSSVISKCFGTMAFSRNVVGSRASMLHAVLNHFNINEKKKSWRTPSLCIDEFAQT